MTLGVMITIVMITVVKTLVLEAVIAIMIVDKTEKLVQIIMTV